MLRPHRYLILLVVLVAFIFIESFAHRELLGSGASDAIIAVLALAVFWVVFDGPRERAFALVTAIGALAFAYARYLPIGKDYPVAHAMIHHALMMTFLGFAVAVILSNIFSRRTITGDDVLGAICGYLLAAGFFANAYAMTAIAVPNAFSIAQESQALNDTHSRTALFNYFSMVTLTTMGYGDVTPARPPATAIAVLEAVFGQFYIAIVVAQLVGLRMAQGERKGDAPEA
jgi:hypothetical protein